MSFIKWGMDWLEAERRANVVENCTIDGITLPATVVECDGDTWPGAVKLEVPYFKFIFTRKDLIDNNVKIHRGLVITYKGQEYEVVPDRRNFWHYNDPERLAVTISTVMRNETVSNS